eukprot:6199177-Pleurochrysis_carterae.AAC.2
MSAVCTAVTMRLECFYIQTNQFCYQPTKVRQIVNARKAELFHMQLARGHALRANCTRFSVCVSRGSCRIIVGRFCKDRHKMFFYALGRSALSLPQSMHHLPSSPVPHAFVSQDTRTFGTQSIRQDRESGSKLESSTHTRTRSSILHGTSLS